MVVRVVPGRPIRQAAERRKIVRRCGLPPLPDRPRAARIGRAELAQLIRRQRDGAKTGRVQCRYAADGHAGNIVHIIDLRVRAGSARHRGAEPRIVVQARTCRRPCRGVDARAADDNRILRSGSQRHIRARLAGVRVHLAVEGLARQVVGARSATGSNGLRTVLIVLNWLS
jgi:hypothetical protein